MPMRQRVDQVLLQQHTWRERQPTYDCAYVKWAQADLKSVLIYSCSNPNPNIPIKADCATLANLITNGAPAGSTSELSERINLLV